MRIYNIMDQLRRSFTPYVRGVLPSLYNTPHSQIHQYNRTGSPPYDTPLPNISHVATNKPRYELVVFNDCFPHDRCNIWKHSKQMKRNYWSGNGCAINSLRFLNVIDRTTQIELIDSLTDSGTPFETTIEFIKEITKSRHIVEKEYPINVLDDSAAFFSQLETWMPVNSCTIFRANGAYGDNGHTAILAKGEDGKLYMIDPYFNRIVLNDPLKFFINNVGHIASVSLMFKINTATTQRGNGTKRRRKRRLGYCSFSRKRCLSHKVYRQK